MLPQGQALISDEKLSFIQGAGFQLSKQCWEGDRAGSRRERDLSRVEAIKAASFQLVARTGVREGVWRGGWSGDGM